jgi:phenylpropionate dioxygenase-like ring-hydroxylating dioxygenase large terminal subunit
MVPMIEAQHWHPVALATDLATEPLAAVLLGQALVLWRDGAGVVQAWADQCPHRGARLSLGKVVNGKLECGYHGWQFESGGRCVAVPAVPAFQPPATHCARVFAAREAHGLLWVRLQPVDEGGDQAPADLPQFAAESDPQLRKLNCGPYDVATSAPRIVENFLDMAHFGFVHEGLLGSRGHTAIADYAVKATPHGLLATQCRAWQPQSNVHSASAAEVEYSYEVTAPYTAVLTKVPDAKSMAQSISQGVALENFRESIALFICPLTPETSRVWFRLAVADFESPDQQLRDFQHRIFLQDQPVLESQSPQRLPLDPRAEWHSAADKASAAYRRHLKQLGITFGVC